MYLLNGKKKHVQKHLLLANLKELHSNFLKENGVLKVGQQSYSIYVLS